MEYPLFSLNSEHLMTYNYPRPEREVIMGQRMTWEEMKKAFPDEWLRIVNYEMDEVGEIKSGEVLYHSSSKEEVYSQPLTGKSEAFWYTGESTFSGLRSHATHNCL